MNYLWSGMILVGILYATITGTLPDITQAAIDSSKEAVMLCVTMAGVLSFWMGFMEIATEAGVIRGATRKLQPVLRFLFPRLYQKQSHAYVEARKWIATNIIANVLGLGWAATPAGLKAMEALQEINQENCIQQGTHKNQNVHIATREMCTFLIINISSLQLIPINIIAYRSQYGSVNPSAIVGPGLVATAVSTLVAVVFCKAMDRGHKDNAYKSGGYPLGIHHKKGGAR